MMRRLFPTLAWVVFLVLANAILSGCERPATISTWRPMETAKAVTGQGNGLSFTPTASGVHETTIAASTPLPTPSELPNSLPKSLKGYELYSWQNGNEWNFTLITATNRSKAFDEIISSENMLTSDGFVKLSVTGVNEIKKMVALLPEGEQIFWAGMDLTGQVPGGTIYLTFPPRQVIDDLTAYCRQHKITLQILKEP